MIKSLQSLRLIFAIVIFLHHYPYRGSQLFLAGGDMGVCFFIILSGFAMSAGYGERSLSSDFSYKHYFLKRLVRLWPLHLLCLCGLLVLNQSIPSSLWSIGVFGLNALMLQSWIPIPSVYFSWNAVSWCLCDLMFCYLMFPLIYRFFTKKSLRTISQIGCIVLAIYFVSINFLSRDWAHALVYISPIFRLLDFIIGIIAYKVFVYLSNDRVKSLIDEKSTFKLTLLEISIVLILVGFVMLYPIVPFNYSLASMWWPVCFIIIIIFSLLDIYRGGYLSVLLQKDWLVNLSTFSFTFYVIHQIAIPKVLIFLNRLPFTIPYVIQLITCLILIMFAAWVINKYFEKPVAKYLSKLI